jgi:hypothetical protein
MYGSYPRKLKEASRIFRICSKILEAFKLNILIVIAVMNSFADPKIRGTNQIMLKRQFMSFEIRRN